MVLTGDPADENTLEHPEKVVPYAATVEGQGGEWSVACESYSLTVLTFGDGHWVRSHFHGHGANVTHRRSGPCPRRARPCKWSERPWPKH